MANGQSNVIMGMPFKSHNMFSGNMFSLARNTYIKTDPTNNQLPQYADSSDYISRRKMVALGKMSTNKDSQLFSFKAHDSNVVKAAIAKCRNGGCVAPKKKGAY